MKTFEEILSESCHEAWPGNEDIPLSEWFYQGDDDLKVVYLAMKKAHDQAVELSARHLRIHSPGNRFGDDLIRDKATKYSIQRVKDMLK